MKKTVRSLWTSAIALVLCVSMLLGTTFAWFTDSVSSDRNTIAAGNLDVELEYLKGNSWKPVREDTNVFKDAKWEPGYTEVVYLRVSNLGELALKYMLSVAIANEIGSVNVNGDSFRLSDFIKIAAVEDVQTPFADRAAARKAATDAGVKGLREGHTKVDRLAKGAVDYVALVLYIPETVGNEANYRKGESKPQIDLGLNLVATQADAESDGFGTDYDKDASFPALDLPGAITVQVEKDASGKLLHATLIKSEDESILADIPAGVKMAEGADALSFLVEEMDNSGANIQLADNEILRSLNVHIEGVAADNDVAMTITVKEAMMPGLNLGNFKLYHVENGVRKDMTRVASLSELDLHNEFVYDPVTGDVTLAMASFSEVALVAETDNAWEGEFDYSWYTNAVAPLTADEPDYIIANADQLAAFGAIVGGMDGQTQDSFAGKTVKLIADINLGDAEASNNPDLIFYPIGYYNNEGTYEKTGTAITSGFQTFEGIFDGNGNTIANFYQNTWEMKGDNEYYAATEQCYRDGMGLFGKVYGGTVKNLTVKSFSSDGEYTTTGVIAAYADSGNGKSATFENITIFNCNPRVYNIGNGGIVGCAGWYSRSDETANGNPVIFKNITVDQSNKISALWGSYDVPCGGILGQYYPDSACGVSFENCHIAAIMDVNNDVCANYQYYWYRYSGMLIGTIRANTTEGNYTVADTTGISVTDCTYTLGDWNEYWYCELVKNSLASYTHDHQFSRLTKIESLSEIQDGSGNWSKEGNFVIPAADNSSATCYHIFKKSDGTLYQHFHDVADESNPNIYETFDLDGNGLLDDLKEDRQCYFMPFNQVMSGLGYGVKPTYAIDGLIAREDGLVSSESKFSVLNSLPSYRPGQTISLGQLVALKAGIDESKLSKATLYALVSPATDNENTKVSATYSLDEGNWENSTITFGEDCSGAIKIVITDYFYCQPTVIILNEEGKSEKFIANAVDAQKAYTQITLGTLFSIQNSVTAGNTIAATITDPNGVVETVSGTASDWTEKAFTLTKEGTYTVTICDDDTYCAATQTTITVNKVDKFEKKFNKDFLYRVGSADDSPVALGSLFGEIGTGVQNVSIIIQNIAGNANGAYTSNATWNLGTIQFSGSGVVMVTISADGANAVELYLEVVDATNITNATAGTGKNFVLLQDVTFSGTYLYYKNSTLYGNGFKINITGADHNDLKDTSDTSSNKFAYCNIWMVDSRFDNVEIIGSVYPEVGMTADSDYGNAAVRTEGDCYITNSYISNCRVPLRIQGNTTLMHTVVDGGRYANIELRSGKLTLDGVTTINTVREGSDDKTSVIGFGIVIHSEAANASIAVIGDGLKQYNWVGKKAHQSILSGDNNLSSAYKLIFNANNSDTIYFDYNDDRYVNTGILCLCADITKDAVTGLGDRYCQEVSGYDAWVLTYDNSKHTEWFEESVSAKDVDVTHKQSPVIPKYSGNDNPTIEFTKGETYDFDTSVLTAEKFGQTLEISSVIMDGKSYNYGDKISISEGGIFEIIYTVIDPYNYNADASSTTTVHHTVSITLTAIAKDAEILAPKFTFIDQNGNKYESTTVKAGDKTYVMPNVTAADPTTNSMSSINIGSASISGTTVYFPIAKGYTVRSGSNFNRYYPLFNGINITDYTIAGDTTGTTYTTSGNYTSLVGSSGTKFIIPANGGQTNCGDYVKTDGQAGNAAGNSDSGWQGSGYSTSYGGTYLKSGNTNASSGADSNGYERIVWIEYCFNAGNGDVYYYRIGYHCNKESAQSCVTPDTLVTLADGTQKRIDAVTYSDLLLVWNFYTGEYTVAPMSILMNHGYSNATVTTLYFADGTSIKTIGGHGFFDVSLNAYVLLDESNAADYIGHSFVKQAGDGYETTTLVSYSVEERYTEVWSVLTAEYYNCILEGMWSLTAAEVENSPAWLMPYEIGEDMKYDAEKMQADIEEYGLYAYEDFEGLCTYEQFVALGLENFKVSVGKGFITWDEILYLLSIHVG